MNIMTFNTQHCLNYIQQKIDYQVMAETIKKCEADIVGLNEMYDKGEAPDFENQTRILSELTGLNYYYFAKALDDKGPNPYGNAILSRYPILKEETILIPDPIVKQGGKHYETRCILKVELKNGITVLVTHFGLNTDEKENAVAEVIKNIKKEKCILLGDFNLKPEDEILNPIRACMCDAAKKFTKPLKSYPSDEPVMKIDYIFVSPDIEIEEADIPDIVASDHRPHIAKVNICE